ncbi:ABC transporter ATP-binding protein [Dechloromonas denitrificans]|uniref:ABC transporter ATP-binding protein n=1 Tax=Dechloromonas denitrificans TaxID=281362 RepID=UPI001CFA6981|nr:ABC transporter ATP-binding protein [Dechloromonas denitrificans]UCV06409.1 ABC transporter ATP-binding protein [Dechloromonas denitrificans]
MLKLNKLATSYGRIRAVREASLHVEPGELIALIGPNGAGKSTLLNTISGLLRPVGGTVHFFDQDITGWRADKVARAGLLQVPEGRQVLGPLTVEDNLLLGRQALAGRESRHGLDDVYALFPILLERSRQKAGTLSGGQQQMLAIGRALMGGPRLLVLDEPSLGLAPIVVNQVFEALQTLRQCGLTILLVEQNASLALAVSDRAYVMEHGRIVLDGPSQDLRHDPRIIEHYLPSVEGAASADAAV